MNTPTDGPTTGDVTTTTITVRWPNKLDYPFINDNAVHHQFSPTGIQIRAIVRDGIHFAGRWHEINRCLVDHERRGYIAWREPQTYYGGGVEDSHWYIASLYVCEAARRKGVGRALVEAVRLLANGVPLCCEAERDATPFWTSVGFTPFRGDEIDGSKYTHMQLVSTQSCDDLRSLIAAIGPAPPLAPEYPKGGLMVPPSALKPLILVLESTHKVRNAALRVILPNLNPVVLKAETFIPATDGDTWKLLRDVSGVEDGRKVNRLSSTISEFAVQRVTPDLVNRCQARGIVVLVLDSGNDCLQSICVQCAKKLATHMLAHIESATVPPGVSIDDVTRNLARFVQQLM